MFSASTYRPDSQPLGYFKGHAVFLATALVALHVAAMLLGVLSPQGLGEALSFAPGQLGSWGQVWRWATYAFVHQPSIGFLLEMFFLYRFGMEIEKVFGRRTLAVLYGGLVLLPPLLVSLSYGVSGGPGYFLSGTGFSHFCLFLGICLLYPGALMFCSLPWLTLKLAGSLLLGIYVLGDLASREWMSLGLLLANVVLTYVVLRRAGLSPRFAALEEAVRGALPQARAAAPSRRGSGSRGAGGGRPGKEAAARYYEPKLKPKADLAPERKAVEDVDLILEKIARSGMGSLTAAETAALQQASSRLKDTDY